MGYLLLRWWGFLVDSGLWVFLGIWVWCGVGIIPVCLCFGLVIGVGCGFGCLRLFWLVAWLAVVVGFLADSGCCLFVVVLTIA